MTPMNAAHLRTVLRAEDARVPSVPAASAAEQPALFASRDFISERMAAAAITVAFAAAVVPDLTIAFFSFTIA